MMRVDYRNSQSVETTQLLAASAGVRWQARERRIVILSGSRVHGVLTLSLRRCKLGEPAVRRVKRHG